MRRSMAMQERVAMVISKPPVTRTTPEIDVLLPWLRKRSDLLRDLERNVLIDVLRQCECRRAIQDDVIIRQGETGDALFIILSGTVSVYVDAKKTGENIAPEKPKPIIHLHDLKTQQKTSSHLGPTKTKQPSHLDNKHHDHNRNTPHLDNNRNIGSSASTRNIATPTPNRHIATPAKKPPDRGSHLGSSHLGIPTTQDASRPASSQNPPGKSHNASHGSHLELPAVTSSFLVQANEDVTASEDEEEIQEEIEAPKQQAKLDRSIFGKWVVNFGVGQCFGELALINADSVRNATILADEDCVFMMISRDVFNTTLKSYQEKEYLDRQDFIETHPVFRHWNNKFKKLLEMSLIKETHSFNTTIIRQGEPCRGLMFLRRGRVKLSVEPDLHQKQYPERLPFKAENDVYELELATKKRGKKADSPLEPHTVESKQVHVKRKHGYHAAEQRIFSRSVPLCTLEEGEMIGDVELVNNLASYMHTVTCAAHTVLYVLTPKNFERLINHKNNRSTLEALRGRVETKLQTRIASQQGAQVPLLKHLLFKLTEELEPKPVEIPPLRGTKELPGRDVLFQHLVQSFKKNKAQMIEPHVPGAIYYREMMREKAHMREMQARQRRKKTKSETQAELNAIQRRARKRREFTNKVARSSHALARALEEQRQREEEMRRRIITHVIRATEEEEVRLMHEEELAAEEEKRRETQQLTEAQLKDESKAQQSEVEPEANAASDILNHSQDNRTVEPEESQKEANGPKESKEPTEKLDVIKEATEPELPVISSGPNPLSRKASMILERIKTFLTEIDATSDPGDTKHRIPEDDVTEEAPKRAESAAGVIENIDIVEAPIPDSTAHALEAARFLSQSADFAHSPTPPPKPQKPRNERFKVHYISSLRRSSPGAFGGENPAYRDWETSERTLTHLEQRVLAFTQRQTTEKVTGLPKLRRFEADDDSAHQPIPGGRVLVRRRDCPAAAAATASTGSLGSFGYALNNHRHVHYRIIPRIHHAAQLRKHKMLRQMLTDQARAEKAGAN